jgi:hypothetical protein
MAEDVIAQAGEQFDLAKAKELAHHYRWRAKMANPREYGDKTSIEHSGELTLFGMLSDLEKANGPA